MSDSKLKFESEANMLKPVTKWMTSLGLTIKAEFITPWGMCDLVGSSPRKRSLSKRVRSGQIAHVASLTRTALLLAIPDIESNATISLQELVRLFAPVIPEHTIVREAERLVTDRFVLRRGVCLQRLNGWMPLHKRLVAIELKLHRVEEAMHQAVANLAFADESYVALPSALAFRVHHKPQRWNEFFEQGVGLISVSTRSCQIVRKSSHTSTEPDPILQFYAVEKFWKSFLTNN
jgi:hypothetical protein